MPISIAFQELVQQLEKMEASLSDLQNELARERTQRASDISFLNDKASVTANAHATLADAVARHDQKLATVGTEPAKAYVDVPSMQTALDRVYEEIIAVEKRLSKDSDA
jgi:hypothetical protein